MDPQSSHAAILDSVLDYDPTSARTGTQSADVLIREVERRGLTIDWLLETHIHADHLSAAPYLQSRLGGRIGIGREILRMQQTLGPLFHPDHGFARDGAAFDHLFENGERFLIGSMPVVALHVPGHTPADLAYLAGQCAYVGDTLLMPDCGTARADFPGGDARQLYRSIRKILSLPAETRLYLCHDYTAPGRPEVQWQTTVAEQRAHNIHMHDGMSEDAFVALRSARDRTLGLPCLILPSVQVNMNGGRLPEAEANGVRYLKIPLNSI
ncbi:MBL fold metallo-hydrolase [Alphaproteobacteria bacterium LMG 31809]|uniref:MBL fold metallo-hydrolase n=2 Tax=Govanella unica TaxID=2975056 RepID=A0A9X3U0Y5_9PROT|nr:MBL fold metallo-hydrolase [Govania unica]